MSTQEQELPTFTIRRGARETVQVDFAPRLSSGDHLVGVPSISTATLRGYSTAGSLTITNLAFETGDAPTRLSFLAHAMTAHVEYRLDCTANTQNGEIKIIPVKLVVEV